MRRLGIVAGALSGLALIAAVASVRLSAADQTWFAVGSVAVFLLANQWPGRRVSLALVALSLAVTVRYLAWRLTETLEFGSWPELILGTGLLVAELYAALMLALGYLASAHPLHRRPVPLPDDPALWPTVDVFVPTYDEDLHLVRATVLAALAMDWPEDRMRIWLLDDGRRAAFREFAAAAGCDYLARADNRHAKAGNLNHALAHAHADFVAVLDCDHIPTRAFLQLSVGCLVADPALATVQLPQHFYTPDPFQRNAAPGLPAQDTMFHGLLQDGNDTWDATFFSGSCAVLRRAALDEVGGFATETVTEDAHTALKLHRRGWGSAFLRLPLAAGLATERLSHHIRQRARWTRGMLQVLRLDNPLLGRGLSLGQRISYMQATLHFLFALPRVVFLTAPLAFLLLGLNTLAASPLAILAYALPHIIHAVGTSSRLQRRWRHSFWGEVYETTLALSLVRLTLGTLLLPRRARFTVTAKGGVLEAGAFDLRSVWPNLVLALLLMLGLVRGVLGLVQSGRGTLITEALWLNTIWGGVSLLFVLAALAAGREGRQPHRDASLRAILPVNLRLPDGRTLAGTSLRLSRAEGVLDVPPPVEAFHGGRAVVAFGPGAPGVQAQITRWDGASLTVAWQPADLAEESTLIQALFGRADAWADWPDCPPDRPWRSLLSVLASIGRLFRRGVPAAAAVLLLLAGALAHAQGQATVRPIPGEPAPASADDTPAPPPTAPPADAPAQPPAAAPAAADGVRQAVYTLRQLGAPGPLSLRGTSVLQGVDFGIRTDEVVTSAQLNLSGAISPALMAQFSSLTVMLNDQYVGTVPANPAQPGFSLDMPIAPALFRENNRLEIHFAGRLAADCPDPLSPLLWATVSDASSLTLGLQRLAPQRDLGRLPLPFFDRHERETLTLPFVLPASAGNDTLRAAGIVASWFGQHAGFRGARFPVATALPAEGNAVLLAVGGEGATPPGLPPVAGPTLAVLPNPTDPLGSVLVIAGRTGDEAVAAANALALGIRVLGGPSATVQAPDIPERQPYDAPGWVRTDQPVRLGELVDSEALQVAGYTGTVHVPFRVPPDLYTWRDRPFALALRYRAPATPVTDAAGSRLDVGVNGLYLDSLPLPAADHAGGWLAGLLAPAAAGPGAHVAIPPYDVFGANDLQLFFDARPMRRAGCGGVPGDLRMAVDADSTLDLSRGYRFGQLPDLAWFAGSGFPFTRLADLSQTAVVLPDQPSSGEVSAYLDMLGRIGGLTGLPASRVAVVRPAETDTVADRDLLVIGTVDGLQRADALLAQSPVRISGERVQMTMSDPLGPVRRLFGADRREDRARAAASLSAVADDGFALMVGSESPLRSGRSVVALLAGSEDALDGMVRALSDTDQEPLIQGDLALISADKVTSYRVGPRFTVGSLPFWLWPGWALQDRPLALLALALAGAVLLGLALSAALHRRARNRLRGG